MIFFFSCFLGKVKFIVYVIKIYYEIVLNIIIFGLCSNCFYMYIVEILFWLFFIVYRWIGCWVDWSRSIVCWWVWWWIWRSRNNYWRRSRYWVGVWWWWWLVFLYVLLVLNSGRRRSWLRGSRYGWSLRIYVVDMVVVDVGGVVDLLGWGWWWSIIIVWVGGSIYWSYIIVFIRDCVFFFCGEKKV